MIITRRLLTPILAWFIMIVLIVVSAGLYFSQRGGQTDEVKNLERQVSIFNSRLDSLKNFALALATETASNPEVQAAFAAGNRQKLTELTLPGYLAVDEQFDVPQAQFHLPPATSFLRLHQLDRYGDDLSSFRFTVLAANQEKQPVAGLEIGRGGLGMRGVVPIFYQEKFIGTVEYGLNVDQTLLTQLSSQFGDDWQILLLKEPADIATFAGAVGGVEGPTPDFILQASTLTTPFFAKADAYVQASNGEVATSRIGLNNSSYVVITAPIFDYSGKVIGVLNVIHNRTQEARSTFLIFVGIGLIAIVGISLGTIGLTAITRRILSPIATLTETATNIAQGDPELLATANSNDEIGQLGQAFNTMTMRLRNLIAGLEESVNERTKDLAQSAEKMRLVADVARSTASIQELEKLLQTVTQLISERFGIYHVGIFLTDENKQFSFLRAANSEGGKRMLANGHKLKVGAQGIVGYVTETGKPHIMGDVGIDSEFFNNPELPETRSEMALPLKIAGKVIGALDLQSKLSDAFTQEDIEVLSILADQVAIAIQNARSFETSRRAVQEAEFASQQLTGQAWSEFVKSRDILGYRFDGTRTSSVTETKGDNTNGVYQIPVRLRGQEIGTLKLSALDPDHSWSEDELAMATAAAERAALALENARLLEDAQRRAAREKMIGEISAEISSSTDMEGILRTTVQELGRKIGDAFVILELDPEEE